MNEVVLGLIRHALTIAGGVLVTRGVLDQGTAEQLVGPLAEQIAGAVVAFVGIAWSALSNQPAARIDSGRSVRARTTNGKPLRKPTRTRPRVIKAPQA